MTISRARPVIFLRRRISSKARRRVQNLWLLTRQQMERPSSSTPKDVTFRDNSDLWREGPFSVKRLFHCSRTMSASCCVFAITPKLSTHTHVVRLSALVSTQNQILRFVMKMRETVQRSGARRDGLCHALSKKQGPRTSHGQHRPRRRHERFTFRHKYATILQQSAAFNTNLFRCHLDQTEKSESHSGINMLWKQPLTSMIPNQLPASYQDQLLTLRSPRSKGDSHLDMVENAGYSSEHQKK